jgi:hypothetical protein
LRAANVQRPTLPALSRPRMRTLVSFRRKSLDQREEKVTVGIRSLSSVSSAKIHGLASLLPPMLPRVCISQRYPLSILGSEHRRPTSTCDKARHVIITPREMILFPSLPRGPVSRALAGWLQLDSSSLLLFPPKSSPLNPHLQIPLFIRRTFPSLWLFAWGHTHTQISCPIKDPSLWLSKLQITIPHL